MTNGMNLILTLLISHFWMATFLMPLLMVFTFLNSFGLLSRVSSDLADFNANNKPLTVKLLH